MPAPDNPEAPPKLTAGQRLLLLLPKLQREEPRSGHPQGGQATPTGRAKQGAGAKTGAAAKGGAAAKTGTGGVKPGTDRSANGAAAAGTNGSANGSAVRPGGSRAEGTTEDSPAPRAPLGTRLRDSMLKPKPEPAVGPSGKAPTKADPFPDKSSAELRNWIKYLDDRERLYTLMAAPIAAILGITQLVVSLRDNPATGKKHVSPEEIVILGVVVLAMSIAVLVSGLIRRRSFAIFALFFVGFGLDAGLSIFGVIPFWGLGGWMFLRSSKMQRSLTTRGDHPRQQSRRGGRAGQARGAAGSGGTGRRRKKAPEPVGPAPNKRYTPRKPKEDES